ncbi:zinc finger MYM-type protein 1-like [Hydra vulgaris]|uniref:Zinc finger MYM-type protein 1-like n=1 Tax=Hydra vulgaris TaxID=6087 RepID=A0ABM4BZN8_HYDVU
MITDLLDNLSNPDNLILLNNSSTETSKTLLSTESEEINDTPRLPMDEHNSLPKQCSIFCAPCYLFGGIASFATVGFSNWKKGEEKIKRHENSQHHKLCGMNMKERKEALNRVYQKLKYQVETEINYSKNVLTRVVAVVKSYSSRGMSFRGDDDRFGTVHNGNFMMSLGLIAQFDPFLAQHIEKFGNKGKGSKSYLSFNIYEQFISIMAG